ncbi:helix-turn-helix domain-containing protein [Tenacibaculum aquimarinum]|uniref:helix-turn-helix domain-containing protein n=1 Tax=Tenacibaculum aquimarinum TaxID=2910675 RepID=UPI001F0AB906|nr:helix-turn-helix domain-containing protein [Tenacibaculum aquimarinum]MCH3881178.1 helix-turn-helix domain-containing protein [Tenacibaculum aquimarinum]
MKQVQLVGITPEENNKPIFEYIDKKFDDLKKFYQPKKPTEYLTRQETADLLKVDLSTIHNYTKRKVLNAWAIQGRVYYKRSEVEGSIIKLNK